MTQPRRNTSARCRRIRTDVRTGAPSLGHPVRDTGISVRRTRQRPPRRYSSSSLPYVIIAVSLLILALLVGTLTSPDTNMAAEETSTAEAAVTTETEPERDPTPLAATYQSIEVYLPIDPSSITMVAFHQASGDAALHMESVLPEVAADMLADAIANGETIPDSWEGNCIRLWRSNRTGPPDTAMDVGANPGTEVLAPVTGTVMSVRTYLLYDKYDDYEIHIQPDGCEDIDVILIHVDEVTVAAGDKITGGVTQIACVRSMSDKFELQLGGYTTNDGDHVHVQLNSVDSSETDTAINGS